MIGQYATARHNQCHYQVWQCTNYARFGCPETEPVLHEFTLIQYEHIKVPRTAKIGHHNGIDGFRFGNLFEWSCCQRWHRVAGILTEWLFNVFHFFYCDCGMNARLFEHQPKPCRIPKNTTDRVEIKWRLPSDILRQKPRNGHSDYNASIWSTKSDGRQTGTLLWWRPKTPNSMTSRINYTLQRNKYVRRWIDCGAILHIAKISYLNQTL